MAIALPALIPVFSPTQSRSVTLSPNDVASGATTTGTVMVNAIPTTVLLSSSAPSSRTVPASIAFLRNGHHHLVPNGSP